MVTKYGPPYFYVGLAEDELKDPVNRPERNGEELRLEKELRRPLTLTERRILNKYGLEELVKVWKVW